LEDAVKKVLAILVLFLVFSVGCELKKTPKDGENYQDTEVYDSDAVQTSDKEEMDDRDTPEITDENQERPDEGEEDDGWGGGEDDPEEPDPKPDKEQWPDKNTKPDDNEVPDVDEVVEFSGSYFTYSFNGSKVVAEMFALDGTNTIKFTKATLPSESDGDMIITFKNDFDEIVISIAEQELSSMTSIELGDDNTAIWYRNGKIYGSFEGTVKKTEFSKSATIFEKVEISANELKFSNSIPEDPDTDADMEYPDEEMPDLDPSNYSDISFTQTDNNYSGEINAKTDGNTIKFTASSEASVLGSCPKEYCFSTEFSSAYGNIVLRAATDAKSFPTTIDLEKDGYSYLRWNANGNQYGHFLGIIKIYQYEEEDMFIYKNVIVLDLDSDSIGFVKDLVVNDTDGDGIFDSIDNCPEYQNPGQEDIDFDGIGDICDDDKDGDGEPNHIDGCNEDPDKTEEGVCGCGIADTDTDGDGTPDCDDACPNDTDKIAEGSCGCGVSDADDDNDGTISCQDNCPFDHNPDQTDTDSDGKGDACDTDIDDDGKTNINDNCVYISNSDQADLDGDDIGDVCDSDSDGDGEPNTTDGCILDPGKTEPGLCGCGVTDADDDGDGKIYCEDNCPDDANPDQIDTDNDGIGNVCGNDLDGDGVANNSDNCPNVYNSSQLDSDFDNLGDACDPEPYTPEND